MSICIIAYGVSVLEMQLTVVQILKYLFGIIIMAILYYDMEVLIRSISLYVISMARMEQIEEACIVLCGQLEK